MKKILLIISILITNKVYALTYYSDYYKTDNIDNLSNDQIKIEEIIKYNNTLTIREDIGYYESNDNIKDENNYIIETNNNEIYNKDSDEYININTFVNKTNLISFNGLSKYSKIYEIEVYNKDNLINYSVLESYKPHGEYKYLNDSNLDTYYEHDNFYRNLTLNLDKYYNVEDLKIKIYTKESNNYDFSIILDIFVLDDIHFKNDTDKYHIITFDNKKNKITTYDHSIKKYMYYKLNNIKTNEYTESGNILDDYIIEYIYYKRDKLEIDDIIIKNKEYNIEDYIKYNSKDYIYDCNIDINNNGIYYCNFTMDKLNVQKKVIVDINNNNYIESNDNKYIKSTNEVNNIVNKKTYNTNNKVLLTNNNIKTTKKILINNNNKVKKNNKLNKKIYIIILLIILLIIKSIKIIRRFVERL